MTPQGLTTTEANARRARGQGNNVKIKESRTYLDIVLANLFNFINSILFAIGIGLVLLGRVGDAVTTSGLVLINVIVGVFQEARAKQLLDHIALLTRPKAIVVRDSVEKQIDPSELVLGDVMLINAGDQIVVDGKLIAPDNSRIDVDESLLTGESDLVIKRVGDTVYSGSFCVSGSAYYEAIKVGSESLANQITAGARQFRTVKTPLQREIELVLRVLMLVVAQLGILFAFSSFIYDTSLVESVQIAAIIAGLVPNGLILMVTVAYSMGAVRMAGKGALIQQSNAIESLSNVNVLCLDKTGTLTANRIHLNDVLPIGISESELRKLLGDYTANLSSKNRTSEAIAEACPGEKRIVKQEALFSSARKWSGLTFEDKVYVLGAPEILRKSVLLNKDQEEYIQRCASDGLRVLLFAGDAVSTPLLDAHDEPQLPASLQPLGLLSFSDELRPEAKETLQGFIEAGVRLKIISGDNPQTVAALAKQAGLGADIKLVSGLELDQMSDDDFKRAANEATIFGRITPQQKEKLVKALRDAGNYVAMIGDGVNDVLSLKQAHLGIAMQSGSQAARGVADIILLNDSFAALLPAVREGQRIVNGMQDIIRLFLSRTAYVTLLIIQTGVLGTDFPFIPKHNSIAALLTVGLPTFWLAVWAQPGRRERDHLVRSVIYFILPAAFTIAFAALSVYLYYWLIIEDETLVVNIARTAMETVIILCGLLLIVFVKPPIRKLAGGDDYSGDWRPTMLAGLMLIIFVFVMIVDPLRNFFELTVLGWTDYLTILIVVGGWALSVLLIWRKKLLYRFLNIEI